MGQLHLHLAQSHNESLWSHTSSCNHHAIIVARYWDQLQTHCLHHCKVCGSKTTFSDTVISDAVSRSVTVWFHSFFFAIGTFSPASYSALAMKSHFCCTAVWQHCKMVLHYLTTLEISRWPLTHFVLWPNDIQKKVKQLHPFLSIWVQDAWSQLGHIGVTTPCVTQCVCVCAYVCTKHWRALMCAHHIVQRECKAIGPWGPALNRLSLPLAIVSQSVGTPSGVNRNPPGCSVVATQC